MVRICAICRGTETLLLALESTTLYPEGGPHQTAIQLGNSPNEQEWAAI